MIKNSSNSNNNEIKTQLLGRQAYETIVQRMQQFTAERQKNTLDEIWITEHDSVFTLGFNGKIDHIISESNIPVVRTDRGGQVTYHGPGQIVIYLLIDIKRRKLSIRNLVRLIEQAIIDLLNGYNITAHGDVKAPGVYVGNKKIAALGLRVKQKGTYHGLALNANMDLSPYQYINPCGVTNAEITQLVDFGVTEDLNYISNKLVEKIKQLLNKQ
ncbi:Octanoate-[acyl-carrier-protein]-protein-N-octanoyltransferase [hydrothermal vent metagenome]|uniref:lipoyl(octanoyl) transferase n=1 Tax=hydrothermal vent metagenome TaxID=652676 RepID=A0A3B1AHV6_9ZZZZ